MTKLIWTAAMLGILSGCSTTNTPVHMSTDTGTVQVWVDNDGNLQSQGWKLKPSDLPAFASQTKGAPVTVMGEPGTDYSRAVEAVNELKAAGITDVHIGG